jgi:hypothetical protein
MAASTNQRRASAGASGSQGIFSVSMMGPRGHRSMTMYLRSGGIQMMSSDGDQWHTVRQVRVPEERSQSEAL